MPRDPLARALLAWAVATAVACALVRHAFALDLDAPRVVVASVWSGGQLVGRAALAHEGDRDARLDQATADHPDARRSSTRRSSVKAPSSRIRRPRSRCRSSRAGTGWRSPSGIARST